MATYLVTQATGKQSLAVIQHLIAAGAQVHAVVRDLTKELPAGLKHDSIKLFQGESKTFEDIFIAAQGCKGVFLNTFPIPGLESQQARTVVDACKKAGVESVVGASTAMADNKPMWDFDEIKKIGLYDYWASKYEIEEVFRSSRFKEGYTILRSGILHYDCYLPGSLGNFPRLSTHSEIDDLLQPGVRLPWTDCNDVGRYAAAALLNPATYNGQELDIVSEALNYEELAAILSSVSGRTIRSVKVDPQEARAMFPDAWGQNFQLHGNLRDWSYVVKDRHVTEQRFGLKMTSIREALTRDKAQVVAGLPEA